MGTCLKPGWSSAHFLTFTCPPWLQQCQHIFIETVTNDGQNKNKKQQFCTSVTYGTRAACTSLSAPAPLCTLQDQTSAFSDVFVRRARTSHYTHSSQTRGTACKGWYLQTHILRLVLIIRLNGQYSCTLRNKACEILMFDLAWFTLMYISLSHQFAYPSQCKVCTTEMKGNKYLITYGILASCISPPRPPRSYTSIRL